MEPLRVAEGGHSVEISPMKIVGETELRGTEVHFLPDLEIFSNIDFHYDIIAKKLRELSFLNNGVKIRLRDERNNKEDTFAYAGGVKGFVEFINTGKKVLHPTVFGATGEKQSEQGTTITTDVAMQWNDGYVARTSAFVLPMLAVAIYLIASYARYTRPGGLNGI